MGRRLHSERARLQGRWRGNPGQIGWGTAARIGDGYRLPAGTPEEAQHHILAAVGSNCFCANNFTGSPFDADVQEGLDLRIEGGGPGLDPVVVVVTCTKPPVNLPVVPAGSS